MSKQVKELFAQYAKVVSSNPETVADFELLTKYVSYFISGKLSDDSLLTEGMFSLAHLFVIFNDQIIRREVYKDEIQYRNEDEHKLKLFLTVLDTVEVLIETTSKKFFGNKRKFIVIFIIQAVKTIGRLLLVMKYKNRISQSPAIEYLDRKNLFKERPNSLQPELNQTASTTSTISLKLKRSGKTIRKVSNSPLIYNRSFQPPPEASDSDLEPNDRFGQFNHKAIKNAELVYILKPMLHLGSIAAFGYKSWKSYATSLFLDVFSIYQYYKYRNFMTKDQKKELSRRCVNMILYIFRSPFYDKYSGDKIDAFMRALNHIPFAKYIVEPYRLYIPSYQDKYFYMFSN